MLCFIFVTNQKNNNCTKKTPFVSDGASGSGMCLRDDHRLLQKSSGQAFWPKGLCSGR